MRHACTIKRMRCLKMSVSALCTLALKASPSPLATLREYSMNHNHVASTSLPNSFLLLPRCVPSQAPASSPCLPAKSIRARADGQPGHSTPQPDTSRHILAQLGIAEWNERAGGYKSQQRDTKQRGWREWMPQAYSLCARCGPGHFQFSLSRNTPKIGVPIIRGEEAKRPTGIRQVASRVSLPRKAMLGWTPA